jgi:hypothetical protein
MKKEKQIGVRVGLPAFFALEVEDVYRHTSGAHRALTFPAFCGLLMSLGLEQYRKGNAAPPEPEQEEAPDIEDGPPEEPDDENRPAADPLCLFDINPAGLPDLFREFDEAMKTPEELRGLRLVHAGEDREEAQQC